MKTTVGTGVSEVSKCLSGALRPRLKMEKRGTNGQDKSSIQNAESTGTRSLDMRGAKGIFSKKRVCTPKKE